MQYLYSDLQVSVLAVQDDQNPSFEATGCLSLIKDVLTFTQIWGKGVIDLGSEGTWGVRTTCGVTGGLEMPRRE